MRLPIDPTRKWLLEETERESSRYSLQLHDAEREYQGFSRYDWYNFHYYLEFLIARICHQVSMGSIPVFDEKAEASAKTALQAIIAGKVKYADGEEVLEELVIDPDVDIIESINNPTDEQTEIYTKSNSLEEDGRILIQQGVKIFFTKVFPYLPFSKDRYYIPVNSGADGRKTEGFNSDDMSVIRSYFSSILVNGILMFASPIGHTYNGESVQAWTAELLTIRTALVHLQVTGDVKEILAPEEDTEWSRELKAEYTLGMDNLTKYFFHLWD